MRLIAQPDPSELLLRVRDKVIYTLDRLPRYMCTQTVDRSEYELAQPDVDVKDCDDGPSPREARRKLDLVMADRLRLDVGMAAQGEIYSWVGENQFRNRSLFSIVNQGIASTGHFDGFLDLIFRSDHADFSYSGKISGGGRNLVEYRYRVPLEESHYDVVFHGQTVKTAYEGTLRIDPQTVELVRMTLRTSRPPSETGACEIIHTMNFRRFRLNGSDFLLPSEAHLHIKELNGGETENSTGYSGCREFLGESTLKFEPPPDVPARRPRRLVPSHPFQRDFRFAWHWLRTSAWRRLPPARRSRRF